MIVVLLLFFLNFHIVEPLPLDCPECNEGSETQENIKEIIQLLKPDSNYEEIIESLNGTLDGCTLLDKKQSKIVLEDLKIDVFNGKILKTIINLHKFPTRKWNKDLFPIEYLLDDAYELEEKKMIKEAISQYEQNTCIRWKEVEKDSDLKEESIWFNRGAGNGCNSYVGKVKERKQTINLGPNCFHKIGTSLHEIGHSLGLMHEQARADRDEYIKVHFDRIKDAFISLFGLQYNGVNLGFSYDYNSVMHYSTTSPFTKERGLPVVQSYDELYQHNMGQGAGLSYLDVESINLAYCQDVCHNELNKPCAHNGYQDPNNCNQCKCPDGWAGTYCEELAPAVNANCGGEYKITNPEESIYISTPNYPKKTYDNNIQCNWLIKAPLGYQIELSFEDKFGIYQRDTDACFHWLEVRYKQDMAADGPRFCGDSRPKDLESTNGQMFLTFRSDFLNKDNFVKYGFNAKITAVSICSSNPCQNDGKCEVNGETYKCNCVHNFYGDNCEKECKEKKSCEKQIRKKPKNCKKNKWIKKCPISCSVCKKD